MADAAIAAAGRLDLLRLTRILIRIRLGTMLNAFRVRRRGRSALLVLVIGVIVGFSYVGLFAQAFSIITRTIGIDGQIATLALVTGTIAFGSLAARAASNEAVRAGSPENEFLLARPVSLAALVAGRALADAVTDPVGALFLLPVLIAATQVWRLGPAAWLVAAAISLLMQIGISMLAYTVQLAIVRWVPGRRRRMAWIGLRLVAAMSLATLWMLGTWVMRAPAALATHVGAIAPALAFSPSMLVSAPLAELARGEPALAALALAVLAATVGATMLLVIAVARRAGMAGWEEAGAVWAEGTHTPRPDAPLLTAATKDLTQLTREGSQLLTLIAMPVIFVGVQIFGAAGWSWTTASLDRISWLAYSLALYMATIGPLTHMQAERKAFWILRTVPVPLARLLAAKARAWAIILGGIGGLVFAVLSISVPNVSLAERVAAGLLVTAGAAGMSFVAVAMASAGADLSDETSSAVGPSTIYAYMFVGGLFNLVLGEDGPTRVAGLVLYGFAGWTYWQAGVEQAAFCLDAEAVRARRVRAADGATMLIIGALGGRALAKVGKSFSGGEIVAAKAVAVIQFVLAALIGVAAAIYLRRRRAAMAPPRWRGTASLAIAAAAGAAGGGVLRAINGGGSSSSVEIVPIALALLVDEAVLRGIVQRALPVPRAVAALITVVVGVVSAQLTSSAFSMGAAALVPLTISQAAGAAVFALSGRVAAAWFARLVLVGLAAFA